MESSPEKEKENVLFLVLVLEEKSIQLEIALEKEEIRVSEVVVVSGLKANQQR